MTAKLKRLVRTTAAPIRLTIGDAELPEPAEPKRHAQLRGDPDDRFTDGPDGRVAISRGNELLVAGATGPAKRVAGYPGGAPVWHPDGTAVFTRSDKRTVERFDLATKKSTTIFTVPSGQEIYGITMVPSGLVIRTDTELVLIDPRAPERGAIAATAAVGYVCASACDGRVISASALSTDRTQILAVTPSGFHKIGSIASKGWLEESGGRVWFVLLDEDLPLEVHGLDEALGAIKPVTKRPSKVSLDPIAESKVAAEATCPKKLGKDLDWWKVAASGRAMGMEGWGKPFLWLDNAGKRRTLACEETRFAGADAHADGTIVRGGTFSIYVHDAERDTKAKEIELTGLGNKIFDVAFVGDHYALLAEKGVFVHDRKGKLVAQAKLAKGVAVRVYGTWIVCFTEAKDRIAVFELRDRKLVAALKSSIAWAATHASNDRCFVRDTSDHWFELVGLT